MAYNFVDSTKSHQNNVKEVMALILFKLDNRAEVHDKSKLDNEEECKLFKDVLDNKKPAEYGTEEYHKTLDLLKPALDSHYANNDHHPEHFENGIDGMSLFSIVEMFADWLSASKRHDNDNFLKSLDVNKKRYNMSEQLYNILKNTYNEFND